MSDERRNRRTSILKLPDELVENMNKTKNDRRVSFHNKRVVQQYEADRINFRHEPKTEHFSLSSVSSADEQTRNHAKNVNQNRAPLVDLENADSQDVRKPLGERRKSRQSLGTDDTQYMLSKKDNKTANLTLQFGARPQMDDTLDAENTQALFFNKTPVDQTCTEAFFDEIQQKGPSSGMKGNDTMNNDFTEDFLENIASQARHQRDSTPAKQQRDDDSLLGFISPKIGTENAYESEMHSTHNPYFEQTVQRSAIPIRDDTVPMPEIQNDESPIINQTLAASFQPELSSYVLHESVMNDQCKSLREGMNLPTSNANPSMHPSFTFDNTFTTVVEDEQMVVETEHETLVQSSHHEGIFHGNNVSHQITLYEHFLENHQKPSQDKRQSSITRDFILEDSQILKENMDFDAEQNQKPTQLTQEFVFEDSHNLMDLENNQEQEGQISPAYMTQDFMLEESRVLKDNYDEQLADEFNRTVEMAEEYDNQPASQDPLGQTYAVGPVLPDQTYLVATPVVKAKINIKPMSDSTLDVSALSSASETLTKKLNETVDKLSSIEDKVSNRRVSASFKQILAEAKLNRSLAQVDSPKLDLSNCPPTKQARFFDKVDESPKSGSVAIPTARQQTPKPNVSKSQQMKPPNTLQALSASRSVNRNARNQTPHTMTSTPTRRVTATPTMRITPQVIPPSTAQSRRAMGAAFISNTPLPSVRENFELNPMHGPIPLNSIDHLKWAQQLSHNPNWLDEVRVPQWNPLAENYFDLNGPTAGMEKDELRRKAEKIVVQTINKFEGKIDFVRKHIFNQGLIQMEKVKEVKGKMWGLKEKHDKLIEHYNKRVDYHNYLIEVMREKRHAENEQFVVDVKQKLQTVISEWTN